MTIRPAYDQEQQTIAELSARAFSDYGVRVRRFYERQTGPRARPELTRVMEDNGHPVASLRIQDHTIRLGRSSLRLAGVADVGTDPAYRRKGCASRLMEEAIHFMAAEGFDLSLLFGITDFYDRFGYAVAMPGYSLGISASDASHARAEHKARDLEEKDLGALKRIFRTTGRTIWCNAIREHADWQFRAERYNHARVLTGPDQRVVGYIIYEPQGSAISVTELGAVTKEEVYESLLAEMARIATQCCASSIKLNFPPDHPIARFYVSFGLSVTVHYPRNGGGMARILNLESCVRAMLPQWSAQLGTAGFRSSLDFRLQTDLGTLGLRARAGKLSLVERVNSSLRLKLPQSALTQLLLGYQPPDTILSKRDVSASRDLVPLLKTLFPERCPFLWRQDHF